MERKFKLVELTDKPWEPRWDALKNAVKDELGLELNTDIRTVSAETLNDELSAVLESDAVACRIEDAFCMEVLRHLPQSTLLASFSGTCPYLMNEKGRWWPRPLLDEAFKRSVMTHVGQIDLNSSALVAGSGGAARLVVSSLAAIGFATILITDQDDSAGHLFVDEMMKKYFQVKLKFVPYQAITTLPGICSIAVNTMPLSLENQVLDEFYFFNFLKAGGVVADMTLVPSNTPLISEARTWGARHLSGDMIAAERDALMIESLFHRRLDVEKYLGALRALVDAAPFDPSPFLQRFKERGM